MLPRNGVMVLVGQLVLSELLLLDYGHCHRLSSGCRGYRVEG